MNQHNSLIKFKFNQVGSTFEEYKEAIAELEAEVMQLKNIVIDQTRLIRDLQCQADPYSCEGSAICNSFHTQK